MPSRDVRGSQLGVMIGRCGRVHTLLLLLMLMMLCSVAVSEASVEDDGILSGRMHRSQPRAVLLAQSIATTRQDDT